MRCWERSGIIRPKRRQQVPSTQNNEAERIIDREIELYSLSGDKTLLPAPSPITKDALSDTCNAIQTADKAEKADGKEKTSVSAIVSAYNAERFMRGCLEDLVARRCINRTNSRSSSLTQGPGRTKKRLWKNSCSAIKRLFIYARGT